MKEKMLPNEFVAEQAVLGIVLYLGREAFAQVADRLSADDFYFGSYHHPEIYGAIKALYATEQEIAMVSVLAKLEHNDITTINDAATFRYLDTLHEIGLNTELLLDECVHLVRNAAMKRRLYAAVKNGAGILDEEEDAETALEKIMQQFYKVEAGTVSSDLVGLSSAVSNFLNRLDTRSRERGKIVGLPTHFTELDFFLGGLQPQELIILGGRPGEGKTSLLLNIVYNLLFKSQANIAVFSLEMSQDDLVRRLISMETGIDSQRLRTRFLSDAEWDKIVLAADRLSDDHVCIDESGELSITSLRSKCRRHKAKYGLDLVVVDYLQLMSADADERRPEDRRHQIEKCSRGLKQLARELDVPVLACASLNRAIEGRADQTPKLSDLRESGTIEFDADVVMFIRRSRETEGVSLINIEKHRNGPTGEVRLRFDASLTKFSDMEGGSDD